VGICEGSITEEVRGPTEFGWDPIFIPQGFQQTFAEMSSEEKNQISHRYLAWQQVKVL
jgi:non-canonical purine NTP pyrophosphatase (RdgB/HAM1 family)